jgi:hypothetical protein
MDRFSNIFYNATQEDEDTSSELLCNIFRTKYIRDLTLRFLGISLKSLETITLDHISVRKNIDGIGIPDITIENDNNFFFIENKIYIDTPLQKSQKTTYPEFINKKDKVYKGYIFLIPKNYKHKTEINDTKVSYPFILIKYWEDLLKYLYKQEIQNESPVINEVIDYLSNLVSYDPVVGTELNINEVVIMYNTKDLYDTLSFVDKVNELVANAAPKITKKLGKDFSVGKKLNDSNGQGIFLKYNNKGSIFLGLNPGNCEEQNGDFVYSVALEEKVLSDKININKDKYPYLSDGGGYILIKVDRKIFVEKDQENKLVNVVVDIIKNVFLKNIKR